MENKTVVIIIPALNEEKSIGSVLSKIPRQYAKHIFVIDSLSSDKTPEIAKRFGASVIANKIPTYDAACFLGAKHADFADILVFLQAGGDDEPEDIQKLLQPLFTKKADMVMGARTLKDDQDPPLLWHQTVGTKIVVTLINMIFLTNFRDIGPFRAIRYDAYRRLSMKPKKFSWTTQMLIKALKLHMRVVEIPVHTKKRIGKSKIAGSIYYSFLAMRDMFWSFKFVFSIKNTK